MVKRFQFVNGSLLKLIALAAMLLDHTASILLEDNHFVVLEIGSHQIDLYMLFRYIGRISFPIYAFLLVEGFLHTSDVRRYAGNLLIFALLSELPWNLAHSGKLLYPNQNVMFTLLFGLLGIWVIREFRTQRTKQACGLLALLALSFFFHADFGWTGFGLILALFLLRGSRLHQTVVGTCFFASNWTAAFGFVPVALYNGKRGFVSNRFLKYAFYAVYPLHLLVLYFIRRATIGY